MRQRQADLDALERVEDALVRALELEEEVGERVELQLLEVELAPSAQPHRTPLGVVLHRKDDVLVGVAVHLALEGHWYALELAQRDAARDATAITSLFSMNW